MNGDKPIVSSLHGMVAAAQPLAAFAGARMLRQGGNAFDAAVASAAALNVVEPFMSGMAGLGMACCYSAAERRVRCLDFVPETPIAFDADQFTKADLHVGSRASGVPGNLAGWHRLATRYGRLPFGDLLEPAIELAHDGFPVSGGIPTVTPEYWDLRSEDPEWCRVYTPGHKNILAGWVLKQPDLAASFELIRTNGIEVFYGGVLGERMLAHLGERGGILSQEDLERVDPLWCEPASASYRNHHIHSLGPPAEAFQFLLTLALLDDAELGAMKRNGFDHLDTVIRAVRLAAEQRIQLNHSAPDVIDDLINGERFVALREQLRDGAGREGRVQQWRAITDPDLIRRREYTTSLSTADRDGNMVCITQSLGSIYGSGVVIPGTGICMNNFLNWTDLDPASPNRADRAGRIAMCLAPSITLRDNEPVLALGTPGSYGILQTQVQALIQYFDFGLSLNDAIDAPRLRVWDGRRVQIESRVQEDVVAALLARGHEVESIAEHSRVVGGMQAVARNAKTGALTGGADGRRDGYAAAP